LAHETAQKHPCGAPGGLVVDADEMVARGLRLVGDQGDDSGAARFQPDDEVAHIRGFMRHDRAAVDRLVAQIVDDRDDGMRVALGNGGDDDIACLGQRAPGGLTDRGLQAVQELRLDVGRMKRKR
jgi:hypothetical protein